MVVYYIDTFFLINFMIDSLLLSLTAKICAAGLPTRKIIITASACSIYSCCALLIAPPFGSFFAACSAGVLAVLAAFGFDKYSIRPIIVFFSLSAAYAGAVLALGSVRTSFLLLTVISLGGYLLICVSFRNVGAVRDGAIANVSVTLFGKTVSFGALIDTGNTLRDPVTGKHIIVASCRCISGLLPDSAYSILSNTSFSVSDAMRRLSSTGSSARFRLIPYSAVGTPHSMLIAFRPDTLTVDGVSAENILVAVIPHSVSDGGAYSAVIGSRYRR